MSKPTSKRGGVGGILAGSILLLLAIRGGAYLVERQQLAAQQARATPYLSPLSEQWRQLRLQPIGEQMRPPRYLPDARHPSLELVVLIPKQVGAAALKFESKTLAINKETGRMQWEEDQYSFLAPPKAGSAAARYTLTYHYDAERARRAQQPWLIRLTTPADDFQLARDSTRPPTDDSSLTHSQADSILQA